jgi:hypothetical protein
MGAVVERRKGNQKRLTTNMIVIKVDMKVIFYSLK